MVQAEFDEPSRVLFDVEPPSREAQARVIAGLESIVRSRRATDRGGDRASLAKRITGAYPRLLSPVR